MHMVECRIFPFCMFRIFDVKSVKWTGTESVLFLLMSVRVVSNNEDTIYLASTVYPKHYMC